MGEEANTRALLYAAQEIAFPNIDWEIFKGEVCVLRPATPYKKMTGDWSFTHNRPCRFDPLNYSDDWVALREGLDKKGFTIFHDDDELWKTIEWPDSYAWCDANIKDIDKINELENKCPRQLCLDICGVFCGEDDV